MPLLVGHVEDADRARADDAARERRLGNDHQDVEWVTVIGQASFDEAVIARVMDARVQHAIEHESVSRMVVLVLVAAARRDLDGHLDRTAALRLLHAVSMPHRSQHSASRGRPRERRPEDGYTADPRPT